MDSNDNLPAASLHGFSLIEEPECILLVGLDEELLADDASMRDLENGPCDVTLLDEVPVVDAACVLQETDSVAISGGPTELDASWTEDSIRLLIASYARHCDEMRFARGTNQYAVNKVWWIIGEDMVAHGGVHMDLRRIRGKWNSLITSYKRILDKMVIAGPTGEPTVIHWPYFDDMCAIVNANSNDNDGFCQGNQSPKTFTRRDNLLTVLIDAYGKHMSKFTKAGHCRSAVTDVWKTIRDDMASHGINMSILDVRMAWKKVLERYARNLRKKGRRAIRWIHFAAVDAIMSQDISKKESLNGVWNEDAVHELILAYSNHCREMNNAKGNNILISNVWKKIRAKLLERGFKYSITRMQRKWNDLLDEFEINLQVEVKYGRNEVCWPHFEDFNKLVPADDFRRNKLLTAAWTDTTVLLLIQSYASHKVDMANAEASGSESAVDEVWAAVVCNLAALGFRSDVEKIRSKWSSLVKKYQRHMLYNKNTGDGLTGIWANIHAVIGVQRDSPEKKEKSGQWTEENIRLLIKLYSTHSKMMRSNKGGVTSTMQDIWQAIGRDFAVNGVDVDISDIRLNWHQLVDEYRQRLAIKRSTGDGTSTFPFFEELAQILCEETNDAFKKDHEENAPKWTEQNTLMLISAFATYKRKMDSAQAFNQYATNSVWRMIRNELTTLGLRLSVGETRSKWNALVKTYRLVYNRETQNNNVLRLPQWHYFEVMHELMSTGYVNLPSLVQPKNSVTMAVDLEQLNHDSVTDDSSTWSIDRPLESKFPNTDLSASQSSVDEIDCSPFVWTDRDVHLLITTYSNHKKAMDASLLTNQFDTKKEWIAIGHEMAVNGVTVDVGKIREKWNSLLKRFRLIMQKRNKCKSVVTNWPYFTAMKEIMCNNALDGFSEQYHRCSRKSFFWTDDAVHMLISVYTNHKEEMDAASPVNKYKVNIVWRTITRELATLGVVTSSNRVRLKWNDMRRQFKLHLRNDEEPWQWKFFPEMHKLLNQKSDIPLLAVPIFRHENSSASVELSDEVDCPHLESHYSQSESITLIPSPISSCSLYEDYLSPGSSEPFVHMLSEFDVVLEDKSDAGEKWSVCESYAENDECGSNLNESTRKESFENDNDESESSGIVKNSHASPINVPANNYSSMVEEYILVQKEKNKLMKLALEEKARKREYNERMLAFEEEKLRVFKLVHKID